MNRHIQAKDLSVRTRDFTLLAPISFEHEPCRALVIRGPNGSGKTTLLRVLSGLVPASGGTVTIGGRVPNERDPQFRTSIAALVGVPPFARNLTLREQLVLIGASWGLPLADAERRADRRLEDWQMIHLGMCFPHHLSSGQLQMFALALVLSRPFDVLLLDEPEQHLDLERLDVVMDELHLLVNRGVTLVVVTHHDALAERIADQVIELPLAGHDFTS